jgi:hypothetical protein
MVELTPQEALFDTEPKDGDGVLSATERQQYDKYAKYLEIEAANSGPKSGIGVSTVRTKLTTESARALMQTAAEENGYMGKFSTADITQFMNKFDAEQARQIEKVVTSTASKTTPGATPEAVTKTAESLVKTEFPSFFNPKQFASDWVWNKISFADDKSLAPKNLAILAETRALVDKFQIMGVSDAETKAAAKLIAMGKKTLVEYTVELQGKAAVDYPQFVDRFKADPTLTTYDIASPIINMVAQTLEMDPKAVKMNHPIVLAYTRSAGADGKGVAPSYYDLLLKTKQLPDYQKTKQANDEARDSAESLGNALGYGI